MDKEGFRGKTRISITVNTKIYEDFRAYCEANGMKMSSKTEQLMKELVKKQ